MRKIYVEGIVNLFGICLFIIVVRVLEVIRCIQSMFKVWFRVVDRPVLLRCIVCN